MEPLVHAFPSRELRRMLCAIFRTLKRRIGSRKFFALLFVVLEKKIDQFFIFHTRSCRDAGTRNVPFQYPDWIRPSGRSIGLRLPRNVPNSEGTLRTLIASLLSGCRDSNPGHTNPNRAYYRCTTSRSVAMITQSTGFARAMLRVAPPCRRDNFRETSGP